MTRRKSLGVGSVSLILIFCVLCLTIFALLTLSSARAENALVQKLASSVENYYAADLAASDAYSELKTRILDGEKPDYAGVFEVVYTDLDGALAVSFLSPIDGNRSIAVSAVYSGGELVPLQWYETENANWLPDETLPVWVP